MRDFTLKKKWDRLLLTILFSVAVGTAAFAQNKLVTGKVIDAQTNETLVGATLRVQGANTGTATDKNGQFKLSAPPDAILVVKSIGYSTVTIPVTFDGSMVIKL